MTEHATPEVPVNPERKPDLGPEKERQVPPRVVEMMAQRIRDEVTVEAGSDPHDSYTPDKVPPAVAQETESIPVDTPNAPDEAIHFIPMPDADVRVEQVIEEPTIIQPEVIAHTLEADSVAYDSSIPSAEHTQNIVTDNVYEPAPDVVGVTASTSEQLPEQNEAFETIEVSGVVQSEAVENIFNLELQESVESVEMQTSDEEIAGLAETLENAVEITVAIPVVEFTQQMDVAEPVEAIPMLHSEIATVEAARVEISEMLEVVSEVEITETFDLLVGDVEQTVLQEAEIETSDEKGTDFVLEVRPVEAAAESFLSLVAAIENVELQPVVVEDTATENEPMIDSIVPQKPAEESEQLKPALMFEHIQTQAAAEQPLEQTLAQVAVYLEKTLDTTLQPTMETAVITELIREIHETAYPEQADDENEQPQTAHITKELTVKLIVLLQTLGYENPQETIRSFMQRSDLSMLLEAIEYLNQQVSDSNQYEAVRVRDSTAAASKDEPHRSVAVRIGNALIGSLKHSLELPLSA